MPSATCCPVTSSPTSTVGCLVSRKICGAWGISSDRSFRYMRWIANTGACACSVMDGSFGGRERCVALGRTRSGKQRHEPALAVERGQVVEAADVALADEDLRHGAPAGLLDHLVTAHGIEVDPDLLDLLDAALLQKHLGALAIRAHRGGVHDDLVVHSGS